MSDPLYRRCGHVSPNGRQMDKSRPGIPHAIDGDMSDMCYGYVPVDGVLMTEAEFWAKLPDGNMYVKVSCDCSNIGGPDCRAGYSKVAKGNGLPELEAGNWGLSGGNHE